jgi:hypothetical protein
MAYAEGPWSTFLQARYSGKGYFDKRTAASDLPQLEIGAQTLIDVNFAYEIPVASGSTSMYVNVTNVFNELPPAFSGGGNSYDPIGRFYRVGVKVEF